MSNITPMDTPHIKQPQFYHLDGTPAKFDIDEDVGQLLLACAKALDFIHNGPMLGMPQKIVDEMYDTRVNKLIPKLKAVIENRITVQYPYSKIVDMSYNERTGRKCTDGSGATMSEKLVCSIEGMSQPVQELRKIGAEFVVNDEHPLPAAVILNHLATLDAHIQQLCILFGWTLDDIRLTSRRQIETLMLSK